MFLPPSTPAFAHVFRATLFILSFGLCAATAALPVKPTLTRVAGTPLEAGGADDIEARCDLNGDGILDLVTCDRSAGQKNVRVRLGLGDGRFAATTIDLAFGTAEPTSLGIGLLTGGDIRPDIAVAVGGTVRIVANAGAAGSPPQLGQATTLSSAGITLREVEVADLNNDGLSDVIATGDGLNGQFQEGKVVVFLNSAGGFQQGMVLQSPGSSASRFAVGDIDGNGSLDLAVVNKMENCIAVYMASSPAVFGAPVKRLGQFDEIPCAVALGQINGDAQLEMAVWRESPLNGGPNYLFGYTIFKHIGSGNFNFDAGLGVDEHAYAAYAGDVAIADMNFDGVADIVFTDPKAHQVITAATALDANGSIDGFNTATLYTTVSNAPKRISIANLNNDTVTVNTVVRPKLDVVALVQPVNTNKSIDVFLNGSAGGGGGTNMLPEPVFTAAKGTNEWLFTAKYPVGKGLPPGAEVQVQYTLNPDDPSPIWVNIPNGLMAPQNAARTVWTLKSSNFPTGTISFRVVTSPTVGSTLLPSTSLATKVFTVGRKLDTYVAEVLDVQKQKLGKLKGKGILASGTNLSAVTKQLDGDHGEFVWFAFTAENTGDVLDSVALSGPASANGFLIAYFDSSLANITSAVTGGTYTKLLGLHGQVRVLMRVRVSATLAEDTLGSFNLTAHSTITPAVSDFSYAAIEVTKPKNVFYVTNPADNNNNGSPLPGSLREAVGKALINFRNKSTIKFELPVQANGMAPCTLSTELPPILLAQDLVIDGFTELDYLEALTGTRPTRPAIRFLGAGNAGTTGLNIQTSGCLIQGIIVQDFEVGIRITGLNALGQKVAARGNVIVGCEFEGNKLDGVRLENGAANNQIGDEGKGNLFHSTYTAGTGGGVKGRAGVLIQGIGTNGNKIQGNTIGSISDDPSRSANNVSQGFALAGVAIGGKASGNLIGGRHEGERNYIMGNFGTTNPGEVGDGILIQEEGTTANLVQGNTFGRTPAGVYRYNKACNIEIGQGASGNVIGGTDLGAGNLILNSFSAGIAIRSQNGKTSQKNRIEGNQIGGLTNDEGNAGYGVLIAAGSKFNYVGGAKPRAGNVIMGNGGGAADGGGIVLFQAEENYIYGNLIGVDAQDQSLGNIRGIYILEGQKNEVGNGTALGRNVISASFEDGVVLDHTSDNLILGNYIGTNATNTQLKGNLRHGVLVINGSLLNRIGIDDERGGRGNVIRGNAKNAVRVTDTSKHTSIRANSFGLQNQFINIDLVGGTEDGAGFTANDPLDADDGANELQNAPRITNVEVVGNKTKITFTFNSTPHAPGGVVFDLPPQFYIDIYSDGAFAGAIRIATDGEGDPIPYTAGASIDGNGSFVLTYAGNLKGKVVTLTATRVIQQFFRSLPGSTSEFSNFAIP